MRSVVGMFETRAEAESAIHRLKANGIATDSVSVQRMTKKGLREFDCRASVVALRAEPRPGGSRLDLVLRHAVPSVRPDDVLAGLASVGGLQTGEAPLLTRLAQGPLDAETGEIGDPLHVSS